MRVLNLDDNLIASLSELQSLATLNNLRELTLKSKQTDNPVCRIPKYTETIADILRDLDMLDSTHIARRSTIKENREPNEVKSPELKQMSFDALLLITV